MHVAAARLGAAERGQWTKTGVSLLTIQLFCFFETTGYSKSPKQPDSVQ
jgi:hypothetical protein